MRRSLDGKFHSRRFVRSGRILLGITVVLMSCASVLAAEAGLEDAEEPVTLENVGSPGKNDPNEPLAEKFSAAKAGALS